MPAATSYPIALALRSGCRTIRRCLTACVERDRVPDHGLAAARSGRVYQLTPRPVP